MIIVKETSKICLMFYVTHRGHEQMNYFLAFAWCLNKNIWVPLSNSVNVRKGITNKIFAIFEVEVTIISFEQNCINQTGNFQNGKASHSMTNVKCRLCRTPYSNYITQQIKLANLILW